MIAKATKMAEGVYWVGVLHWNSRTFHGYGIPGTTYNAYLVFGEEKTVLIDNVYGGLDNQLYARIEDAFAQEGKDIQIDVFVQNHSEMDHSTHLRETIEKYNQCIVTLDKKKGVIQLSRNGDSINAKTIINVQYENVKPISDNLFMITVTKDEESKKVQKYGVVRAQNGKEETILKPEYDKIGIDFSKFTNNSLTSEYVIYDSLIPVKKGGLWGLSNLNGGIALNIEYADFGDSSSNPNSNVIIIPDVEGIIVKKDGKYGIISKSGKVLVGNSISKVYKETVDNKEKINVIVNNKTLNVLDYIKSLKK